MPLFDNEYGTDEYFDGDTFAFPTKLLIRGGRILPFHLRFPVHNALAVNSYSLFAEVMYKSKGAWVSKTVTSDAQYMDENLQEDSNVNAIEGVSEHVKWSDIGGMDNIKEEIKESIEYPYKFPDLYAKFGVRAPRGILLFGPPGCGKTLLARAVASELNAKFYNIRGSDIMSRWIGESEKGVKRLFEQAQKNKPSVIFIDEFEGFMMRRGANLSIEDGGGAAAYTRILNEFMSRLDGFDQSEGIILLAATNRPDLVDSSIMRPGRIDKLIYIPVPDAEGRKSIFKIHTRCKPLADDVDFDMLAKLTENFSGADIENVCREAAMVPLRKVIKKYTRAGVESTGRIDEHDRFDDDFDEGIKDAKITMQDFEEALDTVKPVIDLDVLYLNEEFNENIYNSYEEVEDSHGIYR